MRQSCLELVRGEITEVLAFISSGESEDVDAFNAADERYQELLVLRSYYLNK